MLAAILILLLTMCTIVALAAAPRRAIVAAPAALVAAVLLIEEGGVAPRTAILVALVVALVLSTVRTGRRRRMAAAGRPAGELAWNRLTGSAGILTRGRVGTLRRRYDALLTRDATIDPFSTFGELRIKLERRVPELIDNYLDEAATAPTLRRHVLMTELLGEVEGLVARAEAVDPHALARSDRRAALKQHLKGDEAP